MEESQARSLLTTLSVSQSWLEKIPKPEIKSALLSTEDQESYIKPCHCVFVHVQLYKLANLHDIKVLKALALYKTDEALQSLKGHACHSCHLWVDDCFKSTLGETDMLKQRLISHFVAQERSLWDTNPLFPDLITSHQKLAQGYVTGQFKMTACQVLDAQRTRVRRPAAK